MAVVIGVRFKRTGKVYYFDPQELQIERDQSVVVETVRGLECGLVTMGNREVPDEVVFMPLKPVLRIATEKDLQTVKAHEEKEKEAISISQEKIAEHKLDMKLIDVEYTFDGSKLIFYFTADGRVDFRELVKDLASIFRTRIELRQIGVRDETKLLGGIGPCGRVTCCNAHLGEFQPVSIRMAKEQNLSLNPTKISGLCGRLMCCLKYEQDYYEMMRKQMPKIGREVETPDGIGVVMENLPMKVSSRVRITLPDQTLEIREYPLDKLVYQKGPSAQVEETVDETTDEPLDEVVEILLDEVVDKPVEILFDEGVKQEESSVDATE